MLLVCRFRPLIITGPLIGFQQTHGICALSISFRSSNPGISLLGSNNKAVHCTARIMYQPTGQRFSPRGLQAYGNRPIYYQNPWSPNTIHLGQVGYGRGRVPAVHMATQLPAAPMHNLYTDFTHEVMFPSFVQPILPSQAYFQSTAPSQIANANLPDLKETIRLNLLGKLREMRNNPAPDTETSNSDDILEASSSKRQRRGSPTQTKKQRLQNAAHFQRIANYAPNSDPYRQVTAAIMEYYDTYKQTDEMFKMKMSFRDSLYALIRGVFPYCGLYIVGSSMSGFGTNKSDMDLCLMLTQEKIDQKKEATEILTVILRALRLCTFIQAPFVIKAKVPILRFRDKVSDVECDLNINNSVGIRNTHLLKHYAALDWRVSPLMLFIKHWARFHDINDASKMTLSSYSLAMLLIHFLQCGTSPPVLPCLQNTQSAKFSVENDIRELKLDEPLTPYETQNKKSPGELFLGFLEYYCFTFDYRHDAVSVRRGCRLRKQMVISQTDNPTQWKTLCIEEPFDLSNAARSVYDEDTFQRIMRVYRRSAATVKRQRDVRAIFSQPF